MDKSEATRRITLSPEALAAADRIPLPHEIQQAVVDGVNRQITGNGYRRAPVRGPSPTHVVIDEAMEVGGKQQGRSNQAGAYAEALGLDLVDQVWSDGQPREVHAGTDFGLTGQSTTLHVTGPDGVTRKVEGKITEFKADLAVDMDAYRKGTPSDELRRELHRACALLGPGYKAKWEQRRPEAGAFIRTTWWALVETPRGEIDQPVHTRAANDWPPDDSQWREAFRACGILG